MFAVLRDIDPEAFQKARLSSCSPDKTNITARHESSARFNPLLFHVFRFRRRLTAAMIDPRAGSARA
jgi:hypothetical protein